MKARIFPLAMLSALFSATMGQNTIDFTFTALNNTTYIQLDSIKIMNRTQGCDTMLYYPDTVLILDLPTGVTNLDNWNRGFEIFQNHPNPLTNRTEIFLYIPMIDQVKLTVSDMLGQVILSTEKVLEEGLHTFNLVPNAGNMILFTARWHGITRSVKILNVVSSNAGNVKLDYSGKKTAPPQIKGSPAHQVFNFNLGDELLYIGNADALQSAIPDTPLESATYTFQFATDIPCMGMPIVTFEGQVYNTVQVFSQCWLKENLNVGKMILGTQQMTDNDTIEKYCFDDDPMNCSQYGGLYPWSEVMQYTTQTGTQGICPPGWHLPTDEEWMLLEGAADSHYEIGDEVWEVAFWRGYDAGKNLKNTSGWHTGGNGTNLVGFSALPGGWRPSIGGFLYTTFQGFWWTSTEFNSSHAWMRNLGFGSYDIYRDYYGLDNSFSVRCIMDY